MSRSHAVVKKCNIKKITCQNRWKENILLQVTPPSTVHRLFFFFGRGCLFTAPYSSRDQREGNNLCKKRNVYKLNGNLVAYVSTYSLFSLIQLEISSLNCVFIFATGRYWFDITDKLFTWWRFIKCRSSVTAKHSRTLDSRNFNDVLRSWNNAILTSAPVQITITPLIELYKLQRLW
jgi:hypothetical protein